MRNCVLLVSVYVIGLSVSLAEKSYRVVLLESAPRIDGDITDEVWENVPVIDQFYQVYPDEGDPASIAVEVKMAYDKDALYFTVEYFASKEDRTATVRLRDRSQFADDSISLVFDPFGKGRDGYRFRFNELGAKEDAIIEEVDRMNRQWDTIWTVKTQRYEDRWVAEGEIPARSISFDPSNQTWGFNIEVNYQKRREESRWTSIDRTISAESLAYSGDLTGITGLEQGLGIRFRPYAVARFTENGNADTNASEGLGFDTGFDLFYKPVPTVTTVFTVNTDFAEAEVDNRVVNFSRFPTFFPEKRAFFLEDASVFSFGGINNSPRPYFSRRIGVGPDGEPTDLLYGAKATGRLGNVQFGLFDTYVDAVGGVDAKHLTVARANVGVFEESTIGAIATNGDPRSNIDNSLIGLDFKYRDSNFGPEGGELDWFTWAQYSETPGQRDQSYAYGWEGEYNSRAWNAYHFAEFIGEDYNPALGFVRQTDVFQSSARLTRKYYPDGFNNIRHTFDVFSRFETGGDYVERFRPQTNVRVALPSGDFAQFLVAYDYEELRESFEPIDGLIAQPGQYDGYQLRFVANTSSARPVSARLELETRPYYDGHRSGIEFNTGWRPNPVFDVSFNNDLTLVELGGADEWVYLQRIATNIQFSSDLVWSMIAQYDNISQEVGINSRVRWTYRPGSDIFFILNQGLRDDPDEGWTALASAVSVKVNATFDF
ncbi:MAG: DUF5916 domain-containing protein [Opitutales bacterium]